MPRANAILDLTAAKSNIISAGVIAQLATRRGSPCIVAAVPGVGSMDARLERKLRLFAGIVASGIIGGILFPLMLGHATTLGIASGVIYGLLICIAIGGIELFVVEGPM